ncbi:MAG: UvrD-helicase domain-containing protein, partial [Verrucomicrobia bacterium]|nr:UvrD-helicase domain-containing protein [Verrucomicrobiota bacterium]
LFSEEAFNAGKFVDLRGHELAPLFRAVDEIGDAIPSGLTSGYLGQIYRYVSGRLERLKTERMVETYNGVTAHLSALFEASSRRSDEIKQAVNRRYDAVLIDEFQDTSPQQCSVFLNLFHRPDRFFHVIGDPKQSIYRFRGADVFSYIKASEKADHRYELLVNYRSSPRMIHAANQLFGMSADPFLIRGRIAFHPARWKGQGTATSPPPGLPSLFFHEIELGSPTAGKIRRAIAHSIAAEIIGLLGKSWADYAPGIREEGHIAPSDIAILVRTTNEAGPISDLLAGLDVPVAIGTSSSLLRSGEAKEVLAILTALLEPQNSGALRAALLTAALSSGSRLGNDAQFDGITNDVAEFHETWVARGLLPAMLDLVERFNVRTTLLGLSRGRRRVTNFMHLVELLDGRAREERLTPAATLQWLEMAIQGSIVDMDSEVLELRIATDAPAVQILTQHTSKGLEYPIVFALPSCPQDYTYIKPRLTYHDPDTLEAHIAAFGEPRGSETYDLRKVETSADHARLAYVAVTRSQFRCHLYHLPTNPKFEDEHAIHQMLGCPDADALQALSDNSDGTVVRAPIRDDIFGSLPAPYRPDEQKKSRELKVRESGTISITRRQQTTSFTGITRFAAETGDTPHDFDASDDTGFWAKLQAGASLGIVFHEIFEEIDFQAPKGVATLVERKLLTYSPWREPPGKRQLSAIVEEIENSILGLLNHPISEDLKLNQIAWGSRLIEARFLLSGTHFTLAALCDILASDPPEHVPPGYIDRLRHVPARKFEGFLDGFIDLIFEHGGRYHLLDWKTNRIANNSPGALADVMAEHHYFLQYHLYGLALDRLLSRRLGESYDPAKHLGNVYYVFLRGVEPGIPGSGVFTDTFGSARLEALRSAFAIPNSEFSP